MTAERHLLLKETTLRPAGEWTPQPRGWTMVRVVEGVGYWLYGGGARELKAGDGFAADFNSKIILRASQLGQLRLQFFNIQPQYLNGLLTVTEWHQLVPAVNPSADRVFVFTSNEVVGQKFSRIAVQMPTDSLSTRCALLQVWTQAVTGLLGTAAVDGNKLPERFQKLVGQMPEAELSQRSLSELAKMLHCSERHFSRLFREEFGVPLRTRQTELRLQRACQLLADSNAKVINVAYESGYRHLGLFNAMFKKRFGVTPGEWRRQNVKKENPVRPRGPAPVLALLLGMISQLMGGLGLLGLVAGLFLSATGARAQEEAATNSTDARLRAALLEKMHELDEAEKKAGVHVVPISTNGPHFMVSRYLVQGNSILSPQTIGGILTNVPAAFGTNVSFDAIQAAVGDLQMAYRERGFVTVAVRLPQQTLADARVKVQVTEAPLTAINVTGNRYYSSNNVMRALPSLHTNMLLNSHVFQRELDLANASRDRQIYPVLGPGPEPGTSALTLKVKDRFPLHERLELNNQAPVGTPPMRGNLSVQYGNLWNLDHQIGLQYSCAFEKYKANDYFSASAFDAPLIANYSAYYRMPLAGVRSVQAQVDQNPGTFGYNEITHKFNLPPATGRPELNFYASRSTSETGIKLGPKVVVAQTPLITIISQDSADNLTLNSSFGARLSLPLPPVGAINSTLSLGADFKRYRMISYNTNNFFANTYITNSDGSVSQISDKFSSGQPARSTILTYVPLNISLNGSLPDALGTTFFNAAVNFNPLGGFSDDAGFAKASYTTNARASYVTMQFSADRIQTIYKDWTVKLHADGQWANGALVSNEQFAMGGSGGVRGYAEGDTYGDAGWRFSIEPRTPQFNFGMVDGDIPFWVRASVFLDWGETCRSEPAAGWGHKNFVGTGCAFYVNIGTHMDARLTVGVPLTAGSVTRAGDAHVYLGAGIQF